MVIETKSRMPVDAAWLVVLSLVSIGSVFSVRIAVDQMERYRQYSGSTFDFTSELWRWYLAMGIFAAVGLAYGVVLRRRISFRSFDWRRAIALGIVPLVLGLAWPSLALEWPGSSLFRDIRLDFQDKMAAAAMWLLVGIAVASGFRHRSDT